MPSPAATQDDDELERTRTLVAEPVLEAATSDDIDEDTAVLEQLREDMSAEAPEDAPEDALDDELEVEIDLSDVPPSAPGHGPIPTAASEADVAAQPVDAESQALELAALRAEVSRLNREHLELHRMLRLRDRWVQTLQDELNAAQSQFRETTCLLSEAQVQLVLLKESQAQAERQAIDDAFVAGDIVAEVSLSSDMLADEIIVDEIELFAPAVTPPLTPPIAPPQAAPVSDDLARTHRISPITTSADALLAMQADTEPLPEGRCLVPLEPRGAVIVLKRETTTLGRARRNNICISSAAVSRDHARIVVNAGHVTVFDMDSANGCYVNDDRIKQQKIFDGDVLRLGDCSYRFADNT